VIAGVRLAVTAAVLLTTTLSVPASAGSVVSIAGGSARQTAVLTSDYDKAVLVDAPAGYWPMTRTGSTVADRSGGGRAATLTGTPVAATMPNGDSAVAFNGSTQYATVADADVFSVPTTGVLTVEIWLRPDVLDFPHAETSGDGPIVYPLVKGVTFGRTGNQEWLVRLYGLHNSDGSVGARPNRLSGYAFNPAGGLGAGSYAQDSMTGGKWMQYVLVIDTVHHGADGWGTTKVYKNGVLRDTDSLGSPYDIVPKNGNAPVVIGARPGHSYFEGGVGKVAVYGHALTAARIAAHYRTMVTPAGS
jgi:Concanavalin A-like lectin/glucanases superfamily